MLRILVIGGFLVAAGTGVVKLTTAIVVGAKEVVTSAAHPAEVKLAEEERAKVQRGRRQ